MQIIRFFMGTAAVIAPMGFVIISDVATPKTRPVAAVFVNLASGFSSVFASLAGIYLSSGPKYNTKRL